MVRQSGSGGEWAAGSTQMRDVLKMLSSSYGGSGHLQDAVRMMSSSYGASKQRADAVKMLSSLDTTGSKLAARYATQYAAQSSVLRQSAASDISKVLRGAFTSTAVAEASGALKRVATFDMPAFELLSAGLAGARTAALDGAADMFRERLPQSSVIALADAYRASSAAHVDFRAFPALRSAVRELDRPLLDAIARPDRAGRTAVDELADAVLQDVDWSELDGLAGETPGAPGSDRVEPGDVTDRFIAAHAAVCVVIVAYAVCNLAVEARGVAVEAVAMSRFAGALLVAWLDDHPDIAGLLMFLGCVRGITMKEGPERPEEW